MRFLRVGVLIIASLLGVAARAVAADKGFFTAAQSARGAQVFEQACAQCHSLGRGAPSPEGLSGPEFMKRWYSVADLYQKSRWTMPADRVLGLGADDYLTVTAYLLEGNGFPAGPAPLVDDDEAMKRMVLVPRTAKVLPGSTAAGFYTAEQAHRGEGYFAGACALCHAVEPVAKGPGATAGGVPPGPGVRMGSGFILLPLSGIPPLVPRRSVADLYLKSRTAMPMEYPDALSEQTYLDIVAYLLRQNGYPPGNQELTADLESMRAMTLPEPGFRVLFNRHDLSGFGFLLGNNCTPAPEGCGATEPGDTFRVEQGKVQISGRPSGYMYTKARYLDFTLRLDMRYLPYVGMAEEADYYSNAGILLFVTDHQVWPKTLEVQGLYPLRLSILPIDTPAEFTTDTEARRAAMRPVGEWNAVEIVATGGEVRVSVNDRLVTTVTKHEFRAPGHIGFQSEGARMELRNIRIDGNPL